MKRSVVGVVALLAALDACPALAAQSDRVRIDAFLIDRTEVTIARYLDFVHNRGVTTAAERDGGGHEFVQGWQRRPGWSFRAPFGVTGRDDEPATHLTWAEADAYCRFVGGRLPTFEEWKLAAYTEFREAGDGDGRRRQTFPYPVGAESNGMNTADADGWPRLAPVGTTKAGINGLYDMGGNVWEWVADRRNGEALTAGGSFWYGAAQTRSEAAQWKSADFYAVYIGFRCAYD
ncbi:formylglycine-generating enzyme family protein [Bradyrhizobium sp. LHD-71]|uniref:formylglycine-generating enzyme family protein n=1 Tax=Bradyrhizobium sp. LHD-71 TaxID=3072141 RepID=UPI00280EE1FD|nr:formylglycine-generating enzyme family protein [Bradyrhizobium sp. LHD-71]MDQ8731038.1 formylglycine-generating enzyme family protein [Bradyrhizobium sp. LHD-71]